MCVLNDIYYNHANFQCKIIWGLSYTKMTKVGDLKLYIVRLYICHFYVAQTPNYFAFKIYTVIVCIIENAHDFFHTFFLRLLNMFSEFFKTVDSLELGSMKSPLEKKADYKA